MLFYCKRLQNDSALNFVQFFNGSLCIVYIDLNVQQ